MLFNSLEFAVFFPFVCLLYFAAPIQWRVPLLLVASCVFYMAFVPAYILILFLTIIVDYVAGIYIARTQGTVKRAWLIGSIVSTCAILFVFKYYNFFMGSFTGFAQILGWQVSDLGMKILLPIGLSFHTFQSLSYVVEVYRGHQKPEYNLVNYSTFVMFFPQLVAGPIERPQNLLHQFREVHPFDYDRVTSGLKRMAWGFFKKLVVADRLAIYVNDVYASPEAHNGLQLTLATFFFAYQIYCDFSGYSDIAIGTARVLGFRLMENFDTPYHSLSVAEFWRRWHISLSTWFKDYVYVPMGGSRVSRPKWMLNVLVTFGISGLWHGANWTYVIWGLVNGFYLIFGEITKPIRNRFFASVALTQETWPRRAIMLATTFALTLVAWTFFRAESVTDAWYILTHSLSGWDLDQVETERFYLTHFPVAFGAIATLEAVQIFCKYRSPEAVIATLPGVVRWAAYVAMMLGVVLFGVFRSNHFIYFQF